MLRVFFSPSPVYEEQCANNGSLAYDNQLKGVEGAGRRAVWGRVEGRIRVMELTEKDIVRYYYPQFEGIICFSWFRSTDFGEGVEEGFGLISSPTEAAIHPKPYWTGKRL